MNILKKLARMFGEKRRAKNSWRERKKKLVEFKKLGEASEKADEAKYGPHIPSSRLNLLQFQEFITSIQHGEIEVLASFSDILAGGFLDYKRKTAVIASSEEIIPFFEKALNGECRLPMQGKSAFSAIPFLVEYRQQNGKKFARLSVGGGHPHFIMATYELFIREL